jgi:hypothetical protein
MTVRRIVIASSTGNRNALVGIAGCIKIPACAYRVDTINYKDFFSALCRGGKVLWGAKVPKALCQSGNVASHHPRLIKKTSALCFARFCSMKV